MNSGGLLNHGVLTTALAASLVTLLIAQSGSKKDQLFRPGLALALLALLFLAFAAPLWQSGAASISSAGYLLGWLSEISTFSLAWLVVAVFFSSRHGDGGPLRQADNIESPGRWLYLVTGLGLYSSLLLNSPFDLYRLGYLGNAAEHPYWMVLPIALGLSACCLPKRIAALMALAVLAWTLKLQDSTNLWDYLMDLPSFLVVLINTIWRTVWRVGNRSLAKPLIEH